MPAAPAVASMDLMGRSSRWRAWWPVVAGALLCALAGWGAWQAAFKAHLDGDKATSARRLEFFTLSLESMLARNEALPGLMVLERKLGAALDEKASGRHDEANAYLQSVSQAARLSAAYLMDGGGLTLAASNWNQPVTFLGQNYAFRPYVQEALAGRFGRFYGVGATTGEAGYFLASQLRSPQGRQGVIAIKLSLDPIEEALRQSGEAVLVVDRTGVVILSSVSEWKYRVLQPLSPAARAQLQQTRQYGGHALAPLSPQGIGAQQEHARLARGGVEADFSVAARPVGHLDWQMLILTDQRASREAAWVAAVAAAAVVALAFGVLLHLRFQRRAERALRQVGENLERCIQERTAQLTEANTALEMKVLQLKRTEAILRETRDAAVQAGKLTVLGQMSAGMTHELNQPLAALHTLSDNAAKLIEQDRTAEARENLLLISQLADRMGRIVTQLKAFARKRPGVLEPVAVSTALEHALMIVEPKRHEVGARIQVQVQPPQLRVLAEAGRLEQVLVNLLRNGLDAVAGQPEAVLHVVVAQQEHGATIRVRDHGPGIPPEVMAHLFEPFHTTKPVGQGLGLGLALSLAIVEGFGGKLEGRDLDGEGAEFCVTLEAA